MKVYWYYEIRLCSRLQAFYTTNSYSVCVHCPSLSRLCQSPLAWVFRMGATIRFPNISLANLLSSSYLKESIRSTLISSCLANLRNCCNVHLIKYEGCIDVKSETLWRKGRVTCLWESSTVKLIRWALVFAGNRQWLFQRVSKENEIKQRTYCGSCEARISWC